MEAKKTPTDTYVMAGIAELWRHKAKLIIIAAYLLLAFLTFVKLSPYIQMLPHSPTVNDVPIIKTCVYIVLAILSMLLLLLLIMRIGKPLKANKIHFSLLRAEVVNSACQQPLLVRWERQGRQIEMEFVNRGVPSEEWNKRAGYIVTEFRQYKLKMQEVKPKDGDTSRTIIKAIKVRRKGAINFNDSEY
jgi:hypothetical protein